MNKFKYIKVLLLFILTASIATTANLNTVCAQSGSANVSQNIQTQEGIFVRPLTLVQSPSTYLNKTVIIDATFDKFSTLGLDYKPAFRSSDDYISFLIKRDDTKFNIPLSELKLFLKRDVAEKFIDLKTNDEIRIKGTVFSEALGDTWIDVKELTITKKVPETKN